MSDKASVMPDHGDQALDFYNEPDLWILFEEEKMPEDVKVNEWGFVSRENALTYMTPDEILYSKMMFKAYRALTMIITNKQSKHLVVRKLMNLQRFYESRINRSIYGFWSLLLRSRFQSLTVSEPEKNKSFPLPFRWRR